MSGPPAGVPDDPIDAGELERVHRPVMLDQVLHWLTPVPAGAWIVDGTLGLGGHAAAVLAHTPASRLLGLDRDAASLALAARRLAPFGARVVLRHADFRDLEAEATSCGVGDAHAILLDLGLSSFQLERSGRGFSFQRDEPLDMRFDVRQSTTAADLVMRTPELAALVTVERRRIVTPSGAAVNVIPADGASAFGLRGALFIADELAQWGTTPGTLPGSGVGGSATAGVSARFPHNAVRKKSSREIIRSDFSFVR